MDTAFDKITGSDLPDEERFAQLTTIEKQLVDDAFGTVIFQFPNVTAWNSTKVDRGLRSAAGTRRVLQLLGVADTVISRR